MGAVTSTVAARFAFFPPSPPSYGFEQPAPLPAPATPEPPAPATSKPPPPAPATPKPPPAGEEKGGGAVVELTGVPRRVNVEARRLRTKRGTEVVAMHVRQAGAKLTLLYSHGNAADLGQMLGLFLELRAHLRVNIMRSVSSHTPLSPPLHYFCCSTFGSSSLFVRHPITNTRIIPILFCLQQLRQLLTDLRRSDFVRVIEQSVQF